MREDHEAQVAALEAELDKHKTKPWEDW